MTYLVESLSPFERRVQHAGTRRPIGKDYAHSVGHALAGIAAAWCVDLFPGHRVWRSAPPDAPFFERAGGAFTLVCAVLGAMPDGDLLFANATDRCRIASRPSCSSPLSPCAVTRSGSLNSRPGVAVMCAAVYATHLFLDWLGDRSIFLYGPSGVLALQPTWYISGSTSFRQTARRPVCRVADVAHQPERHAWEIGDPEPVASWLWLIRVKALSRLAPEMAGRHHPPSSGHGPVLRIAEAVVQDVEDGEADVEADEVGERERPHRVIHPELHHGVDRLGACPTPSMTA